MLHFCSLNLIQNISVAPSIQKHTGQRLLRNYVSLAHLTHYKATLMITLKAIFTSKHLRQILVWHYGH